MKQNLLELQSSKEGIINESREIKIQIKEKKCNYKKIEVESRTIEHYKEEIERCPV